MAEEIHSPGPESMQQEKLRVLFVDDEPVILAMLQEYFSHLFRTAAVSSPAAALIYLAENAVDVIISDERMHGMSGTELLTQVRMNFPDTARILMTGHSDTEQIIRSINEAGIAYYVSKPLDLPQLRLSIERIGEIARLRSSHNRLMAELQRYSARLEAEVEERSSELMATNRHLHNLQELREQMVRIAVHDMKAPLGNLKIAIAELAKELSSLHGSEMLSVAEESAQIITAIVEDMLTVARLTNTDVSLERNVVLLRELLEASVRTFQPSAERKSIRIELSCPHGLSPIMADLRQLRQALDNLISNAVKFTPEHGRITVSSERAGSMVRICVQDTGQGMTEDDIRQAFREFRRLSALPTGGESSTGLGLFIVKKIVELHGGRVHVASEGKGMGTTFTIELPALTPELVQPVENFSEKNLQ